jgi:CubicO group peptidase (beta-lactamase class C family)
MLGGMSGNAGLFSTASDLGILGQMWLNGGTYGGRRYLNEGTIKMFSATQPENHRGLGFDKAAARNLNAPSAPASTYGHTGFTGCVMWIDPENEIVYVFLSNRLHPNVKNWQILGQKVLQNVHQVVYDAIIE